MTFFLDSEMVCGLMDKLFDIALMACHQDVDKAYDITKEVTTAFFEKLKKETGNDFFFEEH